MNSNFRESKAASATLSLRDAYSKVILTCRKRPREEDIAAFQYSALDFDPHQDETPENCRARVFDLLDEYPLKPTIAWSTGNGVQAMWRIKPVVMLKDKATLTTCKSVNLGLIQTLGSDSTQSLEHVFRVCGTINYPNRAKENQAQAGVAHRCRLSPH